ncbi:MAG: N-acetyltransferase family protein [Enterocloster sp.]
MREKNENVKIQVASVDDAEELLAIYAPYVEKTAITFEYEIPSIEEFKGRIAHVLERFPYLKAVEAGKILGYAYVSPFKERAAYSWAVETSIYVDENVKHKGVGRKLHEALETVLKEQGILNMEACIGYPEEEDGYLDKNSARFHAHMGYRMVGEFKKCGYKFDRWYNMVWMEHIIGEHQTHMAYPERFPQIRDRLKEKYGLE